MDSDKQSQATLDLCKLPLQPYTPYRLSQNLILCDGEYHRTHGIEIESQTKS